MGHQRQKISHVSRQSKYLNLDILFHIKMHINYYNKLGQWKNRNSHHTQKHTHLKVIKPPTVKPGKTIGENIKRS